MTTTVRYFLLMAEKFKLYQTDPLRKLIQTYCGYHQFKEWPQ